MPEDGEGFCCLTCNAPVAEFGDICAKCSANNDREPEADYWDALEDDLETYPADFFDSED